MVDQDRVDPSSDPLADPLWDDWPTPRRVPAVPELHLTGFDGPLTLLLDLAEHARLDLSQLSVSDMIDQFIAALARYEHHVPLERRAGWHILAARLLHLWSRLLWSSPQDAGAVAQSEAERTSGRLQNLQFARAAAVWLEVQPQLGREVFARPARGRDPRVSSYMKLMEACLTLLERGSAIAPPNAETVYRPVIPALFQIKHALARLQRGLEGLTKPTPLITFLPRLQPAVANRTLFACSAVSSTLVAALELARDGQLLLGESERFGEVTVIGINLCS